MKSKKDDSQDIREQFPLWCTPKRGKLNPEVMTNIVWTEIIKNKYGAYKAHKIYGTDEKQSPGWCFSRYGQTETNLPCGSNVFIGGEHEDYYDEDFYIYNDVIVKSSADAISVYGYPKINFPPTDSHSATLVGNNIYVIGCLGYPEQRNYADTPVYILSLEDYSISHFKTSGSIPNWLYKHDAKFVAEENAIYCENGEIKNVEINETIENITTWKLCLTSGNWSRVSIKPWSRWRLIRKDNKANKLYEVGRIASTEKSGRKCKYSQEYKDNLLKENYPLDVIAYQSRYLPPIEHVVIPNDEHKRQTINIEGVIVRFDEDTYDITVTVEGILPKDIIQALKSHGLETFSKLEGTPYKIVNL